MILFRPTVLLFGALLLGLSHAQDDGIDIEEEAAATVTDEDSAVPVISYSTPDISGHFYESFDNNEAFKKRWVKSGATKDGSQEFKYDGEWSVAQAHDLTPGDSSLMTNSQAKHHAYSAKLDKPFKFGGNKPFIFQYEVQFRNGQECGGAYVKLLTSAGELSKLNDKSQYSIMFGPDKCGGDMKLHFIFNHKNPKNGTLSEKHWKDSANVEGLDKVFSDKNWHLIRLEIYPDNSFKVSIDEKFVKEGNMLDDFKPAVNPPKMIDDPNDSKPEDWDEREKIPDPSAVKPAEWDEDAPRKITDPSAVKPADWQEDTPEDIPDSEAKMPEDWDVEMDGEWEAPKIQNPACAGISGCGKWVAPLIDNPAYKGKWKAPMISNPAFKGKWSPRKIQNPDFFEDFKPFHRLSTVDAVFFELWTISDGIAFDNILITDDMVEAQKLSDAVFHVKKDLTVVKSEDNFAIKALRYANDNPWMWAVYMLGAGVPLVLFIAFCCVSPRAKKDADYAEAKKTDKPTQEDVIEEVEELIEEDDVQVDDDDAEEEEEEAVVDDVEEVEEEAPRSPASSSRRRPRRE